MQRMSQSFSIRQAVVKTSVFALSMVACATSIASENGLQRYSPGVGGSDMTSPVVPGWYWQTAAIYYKATKLKGNDGQDKTYFGNTKVDLTADAKTTGLLNRLTYVSTDRVLGANVGFTVMQPLAIRKGTFGATTSSANPVDIGTAGAVNTAAQSTSAQVTGLGDIEFGPLFHWEIGDHQAANFVPTVIVPTGDYSPYRRMNVGYGNFYTFRPSAQYAYIGDGWDVGVRGVFSFNTRNKANGYYSGNMFNMDWQAMKFVTEDVRVGLQGYMVRQLNRDTQKLTDFSVPDRVAFGTLSASNTVGTTGNKTSADAVGPAVAWLKNGGEFLLEGKYMKEFNAKNRLQGSAFWLTLSKPL